MATSVRSAIACLASFALSGAIALESIHLAQRSDADLITQYRGAAFEDVFGFGFWPTCLITFVAQALAIGLAWRWLPPQYRRPIAYLLILIFAMATVADHSSFERAVRLYDGLD